MTRATNIWSVALDYRAWNVECVYLTTVRARTELMAIDKAKTKLRRLKGRSAPVIIGNVRAEPSGWNKEA